ncbi:PAS domain S-box protein [Rhodospirillum sp. A1_3_36]|uniref:PAS domain S-box protein n=1 Tax=Rhodospirillum sp. A1_3_36 TaxID=3391666 RepID=UPI0039A5B4DF
MRSGEARGRLADRESRTILATGVCFGLVVAGLAAFWAWSSFQDSIVRTKAVTQGFALTYKSFTEQVIQRISASVTEVAVSQKGGQGSSFDVQAAMRQVVDGNDLILEMLILDASDRVVNWTRPLPMSGTEVFSEAKALSALRDSPRAVISPLFRSPDDGGRWVFAVSHSIMTANGSYGGAVVALIDQKSFADAYGAILENQSATVALFHASGILMVRVPEMGVRIGQVVPSIVNRRGVIVDRRTAELRSPLDGIIRIYSERRIEGFPLIIMVTIARDEALSSWYRSMVMVGLLALVVLAADGVVTGKLLRMLERRREEESRTRLQNVLLAAQRETSPDGILITDQNWRVMSWNQRFLDIWRIPLTLAGHGDGRELHRVLEPMVKEGDAFMQEVERRMMSPELNDEGTEVVLWDGRVLERFSRGLADDEAVHWGRVWFYRDVTGRKRAEEALRRSERRYRAIFESATDGLLVLDEDSRVIDGNQAAFRMHGMDAETMTGEKLVAWLEPETGSAFIAFLKKVKDSGAGQVETRHRVPQTGQRFLAETKAVPFEYGGRPRLLVTLRDITDRREAEDALRKSEQRFRDVTDSVGELIYEVDENFALTFITGRAVDQLGIGVVDLIGRGLFSIMHPEDRERVEPLIRSLAARAVRFSDIAFRAPLPEGSYSWQLLSGIPVLGPHGQMQGYRGACMDITQSRRREMALRVANDKLEVQAREMSNLASNLERSRAEILRVQERFDLAVRGADDGLWDWDVLRDRLYLSPRSKEILGYEDGEIGEDPKEWLALVHPDDLEETRAEVVKHLEGRSEQYRMVLRFRHKMGHYVWVLDRGRAQRDDGGQAVRMVGTHSDITEMRRYEEALRAAKVEAETASRAKSQFLAVMSHEIRTPMTGILGMGDLLLSSNLDNDQERYARTLMRSARTLLGLLDDVLDFSKIEAGQLEMEIVSFHPAELVDDVVELFQPKASEKSLVLEVLGDRPTDLVTRGDPTRLRQVLFNLVGNAVKFTERGRIGVSLNWEDAGGDAVSLTFAVTDTGVGMGEEQMSRLFTPFTQADASTTRKFGGTGLGLTICKRLAEMMGGVISVDSRVGEGATFWVRLTLPLGDPGESVTLDSSPSPWPLGEVVAGEGEGCHVLLVEDNETNMLLIATVLRRAGHVVDTACNGVEGVARVKASVEESVGEEGRYDLVLMDMQMPEMDGAEATRQIRAMGGEMETLPIIALTADVSLEDRDRYLSSGLTDLLTKPVDWGRLHDVIDRVSKGRESVPEKASDQPSPDPEDQPPPDRDPLRLPDPNWREAPDFDGAILDGLINQVGVDKVRPLLRSALDNMERYLAKVEALSLDGSPEDLRRATHALKGMAGQFGATRAQLLATVIEDQADDQATLAPLVKALQDSIGLAKEGLERRLDE